jgi:hypothetical protein
MVVMRMCGRRLIVRRRFDGVFQVAAGLEWWSLYDSLMFRWILLVIFGWALLFLAGCDEEEQAEEVEVKMKADGMEVRCYRVQKSLLEGVHGEGDELLGPVVAEAGFESRFLEGVTVMRDYSKEVEKLETVRKFAGQAVYDLTGERLVVWAKKGVHGEIQAAFSARMPVSFRTKVSVYLGPGVVSGARDLFWEGPPEGAELVAGLSGVHLPGQNFQAKTGDGRLSLEMESQIDMNDRILDHRVTLRANYEEVSFEFKTGVVGAAGVPMVFEVGSLDGVKSVVIEMKLDLMMPDGGLRDEWVLQEEGSTFLLEESLALLEVYASGKDGPDEIGDGVYRFKVPPIIESFLRPSDSIGDDDPFAGGSEKEELEPLPVYEGIHPELAQFGGIAWADFKPVLRVNGLTFREGDFALLARGESALYVKLSESSLELLEGLLMWPYPGPPQMIQMEFVEIEGGGEENGDDYWRDEAKVSRKVGLVLLPGQTGEIRFGDELAVNIEAQIDGGDELVEVRMMLTERDGDFEKPSFKTGVVLRSGEASLIHESRVGGLRKAWVVRASVVKIEEEIRKMRKESK